VDDTILKHLTASEIILPLVSSDFISSPSCERELERALELRKENNARVVPIILRNCLWKHTGLKDLQALLNGEPVTAWKHQDDALTKIGEEPKSCERNVDPPPQYVIMSFITLFRKASPSPFARKTIWQPLNQRHK
jgi:hypothetical protein